MLVALEQEPIVILSTVASEAADSSSGAWAMVTHVIMNRHQEGQDCATLGHGFEWKGMSLIQICQTGFDGCRLKTNEYRRAFEYYSSRVSLAPDPKLETILSVCHPIITLAEPDNTGGVVLYYSPKAQAALHARDPVHYTSDKPSWAFSPKVEQVFVTGLILTDDFAVYRYKSAQ